MTRPKPSSVLPYVGIAVLLGGWLIQYGADRATHAELEKTVKRLDEQAKVTNLVNYSEHPQWSASILAAEQTR